MPQRNTTDESTSVDTSSDEGATGEKPLAHQMLLDILDTVREPFLVLDAEFRVVQANRAFFQTFHVVPSETVGRILFELGNGQWDIDPLRQLLSERLPREVQLFDHDVEHVFPHIGRKTMLLNARLVAPAVQGPRMILLAIEDVTERRRDEQRMADQRRELERSNEALEVFASVASHDLQEPLRKIQAFGDRLVTIAAPTMDVESQGHLKRMMSAATRMRTLINDLLSYSQVTARVRPFALTDLAKVSREVIADLETAIAEAGGHVVVGQLPIIDADALQMRQLLQNLLGNALKFRREGAPLVVRLNSTNGGNDCTLTVADNGIGFNEEYREKIFQMFERLNGRQDYEGSGIGLAICRKIVERHGGRMWATSTMGQGSTFTVTLPVAQAVSGRAS